ncbi:MAG: manganese-binding transcriptional regulator MntR [Pseudomonadota bacterium]
MTESKEETPLRLREANRQARGFETVRAAHQREVAEDYVEMIADLLDVAGEARSVDIAERMGVTTATVNTTLNRLIRDGLVRKEPYRSIFLTDRGRGLAETARARHQVVRDFLLALGIDRETAESDAEGIEHHISEVTLTALKRFVAERN